MILIYVGDSSAVVPRIRRNHCSGNVEASAMRKAVAAHMGYRFMRTRRPRGSIRVRLDLPDPRTGERRISDYIRSGLWRTAQIEPYSKAHDFQWYVIDVLKPVLNVLRDDWRKNNEPEYRRLLKQMQNVPARACDQLDRSHNRAGIYLFYHESFPEVWASPE